MFKIFKKEELKEVSNTPTIEERITQLENEIGKEDVKDGGTSVFAIYYSSWLKSPSIRDNIKQLRQDFEELDKKFDALERYLQIELILGTEEKQTYDWAEKKDIYEFRKCKKTYEEMKKEKKTRYDDED